jgi:hypothetical protein
MFPFSGKNIGEPAQFISLEAAKFNNWTLQRV